MFCTFYKYNVNKIGKMWLLGAVKKGTKKWDSSDGSEGKFCYKGSWVQISVREGFSL